MEHPMIGCKAAALVVGLAAASLVGPPAVDQIRPASVGGVQAAATVPDPYFEARYVPINPCRIVDTRGGTGANHGPIAGSQTRNPGWTWRERFRPARTRHGSGPGSQPDRTLTHRRGCPAPSP